MDKTVYKVRNVKTGFWSNGGQSPTFGPKGKVWNTRGALRRHLAQFVEHKHVSSGRKILATCHYCKGSGTNPTDSRAICKPCGGLKQVVLDEPSTRVDTVMISADWEIVELVIREDEGIRTPAKDYYQAKKKKK